jgi:hypothetical protein
LFLKKQNQISQEQHERVVRYLQTRLNDLRDENLSLRDRYKTTGFSASGNVCPPSISSSAAAAVATSHHHHHHQAAHMLNFSKTFPDSAEYGGGMSTSCLTVGVGNHNQSMLNSGTKDDEGITPSLYTPSIDGDARLESKNELLQQKLNELQKLQMQLNNVHS